MFCRDCRHSWRPSGVRDDGDCPECGSDAVEESLPEIPEPEPAVGLILAVESQIARAENGAILHREMVSWLRQHGVRGRADMLQWEEWFRAIAGFRGRMLEELMEPKKSKQDGDEDR